MINRRIQKVFLLPSFLCLDAPLVVLGWAIAVTLDSGSNPPDWIPKLLLLFFGVWAIYLSDRLFDSYRLNDSENLTERHRFALRFRPLFWGLAIFAAILGVLQLPRVDDTSYIYKGMVLAAATATYFVAFRLLPNPWCRWIPGKELVISICFAGGVMLTAGNTDFSVLNGLTSLGLTAVCLLNCLTISYSEANFDQQHDPQAYYAARPDRPSPSWPGWISGICGCLVFLIDGDLIVGSSLVVASVSLYYLSKSIDRERTSQRVQAGADAILLIPWPIVIMVCLIF